MKFAFIHAEKAKFPVAALCRLLGVTRQGYYAYVNRPVAREREREVALCARIRQVHAESRQTYGSPRVHRALRREGIRVGKRRVERAMRAMQLAPRTRRRYVVTTIANNGHATESNVLNRDFRAQRPNERWVTDITYIWTDEGWSYVAVVLDLFSRAIVGWALDSSMHTRLVVNALDMALMRRRPTRPLLHHSDRGRQYRSIEYTRRLAEHGIDVSLSRKANCWDNAVAESFFATLKNELTDRRRWRTRIELRDAVFDYIEIFYNRQRLHSTIGYVTPAEVERTFAQSKVA
jgi:putative transposase